MCDYVSTYNSFNFDVLGRLSYFTVNSFDFDEQADKTGKTAKIQRRTVKNVFCPEYMRVKGQKTISSFLTICRPAYKIIDFAHTAHRR